MSVYEGVPGPLTYIGMVLNNAIQKSKARQRMNASERTFSMASVLNSMLRIVLHLAGFSALTNAMFQWNIIAGWSAVAVSCFIFSWLFTGTNENAPDDNGQMRR